VRKRCGIRVCGARGNPEVRVAIISFATWLRRRYAFPIRVPVYLLPGQTVLTVHGERVSASFFAPWNRRVEPYIRIATGDYPRMKRRWGRRAALLSHLISLAHELLHYQEWVATNTVSERGKAVAARGIALRYEASHPRWQRQGAARSLTVG